MPNPKGLGDFGLVTPTQGTSAGGEGAGIEELLGSDLLSEAAKSRMLTQEIQELGQQEGSGFLERLLDPGVLLALLGGGAAALGKQPGAGALLGLTGLKRAMALGEIESFQREKAIEDLETKRDKADAKVDKMRGRMERLLIGNPDLFVGPGGEVPDPEVLGHLVTGADIPLYPETKRTEMRRGKQWEAKLDFLTGIAESANTPEDRKVILPHFLDMLGWKNAPESVIDFLAKNMGTDQWDSAWASTLFRYFGASAQDALIFAGENGLSGHDPTVLKKLKYSGDALSGAEIDNLRMVQLTDELNEWEKLNPEQALTIEEEARSDADALRLKTNAAFAGRPGDQALFLDKRNIPAGMDLATLMRAYGMADKNLSLLNMIAQAENLDDLKQLSQQELQNYKMNTAYSIIEGAIETSAQSVAKQQAMLRNRKMAEISKILPEASDEAIRIILNITMEGALARVKKDSDGSINIADWEGHMDALLPIVIEIYQKERKNLQ